MEKSAHWIQLIIVKALRVLPLFIVLILMSCHQDVVVLDMSGIERHVVIECLITDQPGPYTAIISRPADYYRPDEPDPVDGAQVTISDDAGNHETLIGIGDGQYQTQDMEGVPGRTYTLEVEIDGKHYIASSTMPEALDFDYIRYYSPWVGSPFFAMECQFTDRENIIDFVGIKVFRNGFREDAHIYSDKYTDGEVIYIDEFKDVQFYPNDIARVEIYTLDEPTYTYFRTLYPDDDDEIDMGDEIVSQIVLPITAYNPTTNIKGNALGYFGAAALRIQEKRLVEVASAN